MSTKERLVILKDWLTEKENIVWLLTGIFDLVFGLSTLIAVALYIIDAIPDVFIDFIWVARFAAVAGICCFIKGIYEHFTDNKWKHIVGTVMMLVGFAMAFLTIYSLVYYY